MTRLWVPGTVSAFKAWILPTLYFLPLFLDSCTLDMLLCPAELYNSPATAEDTWTEFTPSHMTHLSEVSSWSFHHCRPYF